MSMDGQELSGVGGLMKKVRKGATLAMNETTLAQVVKRMRKVQE